MQELKKVIPCNLKIMKKLTIMSFTPEIMRNHEIEPSDPCYWKC